jgi:hypothetical protein
MRNTIPKNYLFLNIILGFFKNFSFYEGIFFNFKDSRETLLKIIYKNKNSHLVFQ